MFGITSTAALDAVSKLHHDYADLELIISAVRVNSSLH